MSSLRRKGIRIAVAVFVAAIITVAMVAPVLAQQGPEIRVTDSEERADQPDVAIDSNGNVHIAYCDYVGDRSSYEIFYTMLDNNGSTLIDDTLISDYDDYKSKRPAIAVDSQDKVHIVWQDKRWNWQGELAYTKLDPYKDDRNGDAANEPTITLVDDKRLTDSDDADAHARIAIDSNDYIHIVSESAEDHDKIYYMKIDDNGDEEIPQTVARLTDEVGHSRPNVAVDSNNNPHITWDELSGVTDTWELYYMMLDGSDGSTLIDATLITPDDGKRSARASIVVDFKDNVHIVWRDKRNDISQIYYTKLDPSLDDQNGGPANESVITLINDTALTPDDVSRTYPTSAIHCGHYIHITWYDWETDDVHYMILDSNGNTVVDDRALTTTGTATTTTAWTIAYLDVDSNGKAHIVWCDNRHMNLDGGWEVYYTSYQGPSCPSPPVGGEAYPVNKVSLLAPWLSLALLLAVGGGVLAVRRRRAN